MRQHHLTIGLLILICGLATACNTSSNVVLRNPSGTTSRNPTSVTNGIAPSEGGFMMKSAGSYTTNLSVGAPNTSSSLQSSGGYTMYLNLQGQLAP